MCLWLIMFMGRIFSNNQEVITSKNVSYTSVKDITSASVLFVPFSSRWSYCALFFTPFCSYHTSCWYACISSTLIYRHKHDRGDKSHFLIFLTGRGFGPQSGLEKGSPAAGIRKWDGRRHCRPHFELSGVWLILCPLTKCLLHCFITVCGEPD